MLTLKSKANVARCVIFFNTALTCFIVAFSCHRKESLFESDVQGADNLLLATVLVQVVDGPSVADSVGVGGRLVVVLVVVQTS